MDWHAVRSEFPALHGRTFLNTATYGQLPRRASEAAMQHLQRRDEYACTDFLDWFEDLQPLRSSIARLIHADAGDIAFFPNASSALALVLSSIGWQPADEILTLHDEYPNQLYAAQSRTGVRGVECHWHELESCITARTRLVLLSTVNYATGFRPDLASVVARLRRRGVVVYIDGTQSVGALEFKCDEIQPDFLAVNAYKWLISPNGAGFLYVNPATRKWLTPNIIGWRSDREWRNVDSLHHGSPRFSDAAEKYEGGMLPFPSLYAMKASLELMLEIGPGRIERRVLSLASLIRNELHALRAELLPVCGAAPPSQIVTAKLPGVDASTLAADLSRQKINISARKGQLRISPHFYNNEEDVETFIAAVRRLAA